MSSKEYSIEKITIKNPKRFLTSKGLKNLQNWFDFLLLKNKI